jgi:OPA family glycerol-3-phosphate transporter-like MFS transporter
MSFLLTLDDVDYQRIFKMRRAQNWVVLGMMYGSYYMLRYNLSFASKTICDMYNFSNLQLGILFTAIFWAYAIGQLVNGLLTDRVGGRKMILYGAVGIILLNIAFGFGYKFADGFKVVNAAGNVTYNGLLIYFIIIWLMNGWMQSFGAPSIVKINGNWFALKERGVFTGIFGIMIQAGRFGITILASYLIIRYPWQYTFFIPAIFTLIAAVFTFLHVYDNPEDLGFRPAETDPAVAAAHGDQDHRAATASYVLKKVLSSPIIWTIAAAYFCTGVVRYGVDNWFPKYLQEVHKLSMDSTIFQLTAIGLPISSILGSIFIGYMSDKMFGGRRGPAGAIYYFAQVVAIVLFIIYSGPIISGILLFFISFFVKGPHSLLGGAAAMDFGGRKASGFASGLIDCFQYLGVSISSPLIGFLIDKYGWGSWGPSMCIFAVIGGIFMVTMWNAVPMAQAEKTK